MGVLFCLSSNGQYILVSDTIMAVFLFCIILCVVPIDVGVLFYLRSDGQYILVGDAVMAVFSIHYYTV